MTSFQAKIVRKRLRKSDNKNYASVPLLPEASQKILKNGKKIQKIKKYKCGLIINQNRFEKAGKLRK